MSALFVACHQFKKRVKRSERGGENMAKIKTTLVWLIDREPLPPECKDYGEDSNLPR